MSRKHGKHLLIKKANPNRHGLVKLLLDHDTSTYYILTPDHEDFDDDESYVFETLAEAELQFTEIVHCYANLPNWEAQADYDEQWGEPLPVYPSPSNY